MCRFLKGIGLSAFVHCGKFFANVARFSLLSIYVQIIFFDYCLFAVGTAEFGQNGCE